MACKTVIPICALLEVVNLKLYMGITTGFNVNILPLSVSQSFIAIIYRISWSLCSKKIAVCSFPRVTSTPLSFLGMRTDIFTKSWKISECVKSFLGTLSRHKCGLGNLRRFCVFHVAGECEQGGEWGHRAKSSMPFNLLSGEFILQKHSL